MPSDTHFDQFIQEVKTLASYSDPGLANRFYVDAVEELGSYTVQAITIALGDARLELETTLNQCFAAWLIGIAPQSVLERCQELVRAEYSGAMLEDMLEEVMWRIDALNALMAEYKPNIN